MHEAASLAVGGSLVAAERIVQGHSLHALNLSGGLHHAMFASASGFCLYNDVVVAVRYLRAMTGWRVLYLDIDAHHGDGVQAAFYDDPDVVTISFHETGKYLFPGSGDIRELGIGKGYGSALNIPLEPFTDDQSWLECLMAIVPPVLERFQPNIIVSQHGCDGHAWDPLTDLSATTQLFTMLHNWFINGLTDTLKANGWQSVAGDMSWCGWCRGHGRCFGWRWQGRGRTREPRCPTFGGLAGSP